MFLLPMRGKAARLPQSAQCPASLDAPQPLDAEPGPDVAGRLPYALSRSV